MNGANLIEYYKIVEACRNLVRGELKRTKVVLSMWLWYKRGEERKVVL
jgi:hypothetical protein